MEIIRMTGRVGTMIKIFLTLKTAVRSLYANKLRSALTMLGIVIGVAAVVMMISIGNSASAAVSSTIEGLGSNVIFISSGRGEPGSGTKSLTESDIGQIERLPSVENVVSELQAGVNLSYLEESKQTYIVGTQPEYESVRNSHPVMGRFITTKDLKAQERVVVLGYGLYKDLFSDKNPIGKMIKINGLPFKVVGVLEKKGGFSFGQGVDDTCIIPISTAQNRLFGTKRIDMLSVKVVDERLISSASKEIDELLKKLYNITSEEQKFYRIISQQQILSATGQVTGILTVLLAGIAGISLLVGGIGIMNIMLVSVTERTREIGIRKAVGAKRRDILFQFLMEAMILCVIGGIIGIIIGVEGSGLIAQLGNWEPVVLSSTIIIAFLFSAAVGIFFGLYPAFKASRLNPIDALRYE